MSYSAGPPEKEKPRLGGQGSNTRKVDGSSIAPWGVFGNSDPVRQLVRCQDDVLLYELTRGRATSFEVVAPNGDCWCYPLRYQAESKWSRLLTKTEGAK